jgi:hypothetical protein
MWLRKIIQKRRHATNVSNDTQQKCDTPPPILRAELEIPQAIIDRYAADQYEHGVREKEKSRIDRKRFWIEFVTLLIALFGLSALLMTLYVAWEANRIAWSALLSSERPWVGVASVKLNPPQVGQDIIVTADVRNFGKTPSLETIIRVRVSEPFPPEQRRRVVEQTIATFDESRLASEGVLFPNQASRGIRNSTMVPMAQQWIDDFYAGKMQILVIVRIHYDDQFHRPHHTQYCGVYNPKNDGFDTMEEGCNEAD